MEVYLFELNHEKMNNGWMSSSGYSTDSLDLCTICVYVYMYMYTLWNFLRFPYS